MRKLVFTIITSIALCGLTYSMAAADQAPAEAPVKAKRARYIPFRGTVSAVDTAAKTVTLKGATRDRVFAVTADTTITKNGTAATVNDIAAGDYITGAYKDNGGKMELRTLKAGQAPKKKQK